MMIMKKIYRHLFTLLLVASALSLTTSCVEELKTENYYTFTGEMISDYLDNRSETFSSFITVLERTGV